jgi:hypothetical protein
MIKTDAAIIAQALTAYARQLRLAAKNRQNAGPRLKETRELWREEAAQAEFLADEYRKRTV